MSMEELDNLTKSEDRFAESATRVLRTREKQAFVGYSHQRDPSQRMIRRSANCNADYIQE